MLMARHQPCSAGNKCWTTGITIVRLAWSTQKTQNVTFEIRDRIPAVEIHICEPHRQRKVLSCEHIVPVTLLQSHMHEGDEWPINTIGNLALLVRAGELRHNVQTFDVLLQDKRRRGEISEEERLRQQRITSVICCVLQVYCPAHSTRTVRRIPSGTL